MRERGTEQVGRGELLEQMRAELDRLVGDGTARITSLTGESGIGKSTMLQSVADHARSAGVSVLESRGDDVSIARPFDTLLRLRHEDGGEIADDRRLAEHAAVAHDRAGGRYHMVEALAEALEASAAAQPVLVILDDLQWCDDASLMALPSLLRALERHPISFLLARRPHPSSAAHDDLETAIGRLDGRRSTLRGLTPDATRELVQEAVGSKPGPELLAYVDGANGNPFLILEALRAVELDVVDDLAELDPDVPVVPLSPGLPLLPRLDDDGRRLLEACSIGGRAVRLDLLAALADTTPERAWSGLRPLIESGVLVDVDGLVMFRHDLLRDVVSASLPTAVRLDLHRRAAGWLSEVGAPPADVAVHAEVLADSGDPTAAAALVAAADHVRFLAPSHATRWLDLARSVGHDDWAARSLHAEAMLFAGRLDDAAALARSAVVAGAPEPDRTRVQSLMAAVDLFRGRHGDAADRFMEIFETGDPEGTDLGVAGVDASLALLLAGRMAECRAMLDQVLGHTSTLVAEVFALGVAGLSSGLQGDLEAGIELSAGGVGLATASQDLSVHRNIPHMYLAQCLVWADRHDDCRAAVAEGRAIGDRLGLGWHEPPFHMVLADSHLRCGELDDARAVAEAGLSAAFEARAETENAPLLAVLCEVALLEGRVDDAEDLIAELERCQAASGHGADHLLRLQAFLARARGDLVGASTLLRLLFDAVDGLGVHLRMWQIAPDLVQLDVERGDRGAAEAVRSRLRELSTEPIPWVLPWTDHVLDGVPLSTSYRRTMSALDRRFLTDEPVGNEAVADPPDAGWRSLVTKSEAKVLERLGQGMTNAEIAADLHVSRRTVESHLYHVYPKLGVGSRVELAVLVAQVR